MKRTIFIILSLVILNSSALAASRQEHSGKDNRHHTEHQQREISPRVGHKSHKDKSPYRSEKPKHGLSIILPEHPSRVYSSAPEHLRGKRYHTLPDGARKMVVGGETVYVVNETYYRGHNNIYFEEISPPGGIEILDYRGQRYLSRDREFYHSGLDEDYIFLSAP